jgi:hypothetical protein
MADLSIFDLFLIYYEEFGPSFKQFYGIPND